MAKTTKKYRLGKVTHIRCGEYRCHTLVWVPRQWTEQEFRGAVRKAQEAYLKFVAKFEDAPAPNDHRPGKPNYSDYPDKTVAEVEALWEEKRRAWQEWDTERRKARRSFGEYLETEGLKGFGEEEPEFACAADWGHRHGTPIGYDETEVKDLPGPLRRPSDDEFGW